MSLNFHFLKKNLIDISIFILLQYIVITAILILLYSGGNPINPTEHIYAFDLNYLSDLGRVRYFSQQSNPFWIFYSMSMLLVGIGTFLYFYLLSRLIENTKIRELILVLSVLSGLGFISIGLFPVDNNLKWHLSSGRLAFYIFILANLILNFFIKKKTYPYVFYATMFLNILLIGRVVLVYFITHSNMMLEEVLKFKVISQKILIYTQIIIVSSILFYIKRKKIFYN